MLEKLGASEEGSFLSTASWGWWRQKGASGGCGCWRDGQQKTTGPGSDWARKGGQVLLIQDCDGTKPMRRERKMRESERKYQDGSMLGRMEIGVPLDLPLIRGDGSGATADQLAAPRPVPKIAAKPIAMAGLALLDAWRQWDRQPPNASNTSISSLEGPLTTTHSGRGPHATNQTNPGGCMPKPVG
ncbi:hypothetical protein GGTG_05429 [Gaeumannomyces tritici R3-111a-1]|uniref:Uncharacterized protein n=1 Tax=Gaeumannomyces tritici (strain R3-111a-1) TaxID=644352 RepID=J3NVW7_GAET3|nr:hypothetical protein GGTG_05429 [Gaeumannomyces tritici R3-111a-1]EJT75496.1 hypothetical protein GGTG_05429 [Gaeumannomyces tritici R3-111a-1]